MRYYKLDKINILKLLNKTKDDGYEGEYAEAKLCHDIILLLLSKSIYSKNLTIKGGIIIQSLSKNTRRATLDLDIDFIKYPLTDQGIISFINSINCLTGLEVKILGKLEELNHQDYSGKRAYLDIKDSYGNRLSSKIDIGVHKYIDLPQDEYCFDISFDDEGATLLVNSKEQIFAEKLKSLLKFGTLSTRYKDIYDIYII